MEDSDEKQPGILMFVAAVSALLMKFFGKQIPLAFVCCIIFRHNDSLSKIFWRVVSFQRYLLLDIFWYHRYHRYDKALMTAA